MLIARYGELHLKGKNKSIFVRALTNNLRARVGKMCRVSIKDERYVFTDYDESDTDQLLDIISKTFGLVSASVCKPTTHDQILPELAKIKINGTFRVNVNRADKKFPHTSMAFASICGGEVLNANPTARVDLHNPETVISVDIRDNNTAYIYDKTVPAVGGLPYGTAGRALVLLSGGIDSPVATYLSAKRGLAVECLHFSTPPHTSQFSIDKVKRLCDKLADYCGEIPFHEISLTDVMTEIKQKCKPQYTITLMRRMMIRHARKMCLDRHIDCIVTGENLAQVASQTIQGITTTNAVALETPILRPLITYDKTEIIALAKKIGTYDISIEPHADCCTVFVPDSPIIAPKIVDCEREETKIDARYMSI